MIAGVRLADIINVLSATAHCAFGVGQSAGIAILFCKKSLTMAIERRKRKPTLKGDEEKNENHKRLSGID